MGESAATGDIEVFATASARLADPFADRDALLAELGHDDDSWQALESRWHGYLRERVEAGDETLARAYAQAFMSAQQQLRAQRVPEETASVAPPPTKDLSALDATAVAMVSLEPALPFQGTAPPPPAAQLPPAAPDSTNVDETIVLEGIPALVALPFDENEDAQE